MSCHSHVQCLVTCHLKTLTPPTKLLLLYLLHVGKSAKEFQAKVNFYPEKLNLCSHSFISVLQTVGKRLTKMWPFLVSLHVYPKINQLALRRSESRNWGLCVVYIQKDGATLSVGAW